MLGRGTLLLHGSAFAGVWDSKGAVVVAGGLHGADRGGEDPAAAIPSHCGIHRWHDHILAQGAHLPASGEDLRCRQLNLSFNLRATHDDEALVDYMECFPMGLFAA